MVMTNKHLDIVREIKALSPEVDEDDFLSIPHSIEVEIMARQRQQMRNTAVLNRNASTIARVAGRTDESKKLGKQMRDLVADMLELDRRFPGAKARMMELDSEIAKQRQEVSEDV